MFFAPIHKRKFTCDTLSSFLTLLMINMPIVWVSTQPHISFKISIPHSLKLQDKNLAFLPLHFLESLLQQQRETFMNANVVIIKLSVHFPPPPAVAPLD